MKKRPPLTLTPKESNELMPIVREFNRITRAVSDLLGQRVNAKERKISVLVSRIKRPDQATNHIRVQSVKFDTNFLKDQRKKSKKNKGQSDWNDNFSERRGFVI
jgi:hypothetical protein